MVFLEVEWNSTTSVLFAQSIAHHSDGLHWGLYVNILGLDTNDAIIVVDIFVWVYRAHCFVLSLDLLFTVENDIQENRFRGGHLGDVLPSVQHCQLVASSRFICRSEVLLVFRCNFGAATYRISEVVNKEMFAKRGIARLKAARVCDVVFVYSVGECLTVKVNVQAACLRVELFKAKRVHDYLDLFHHFILSN